MNINQIIKDAGVEPELLFTPELINGTMYASPVQRRLYTTESVTKIVQQALREVANVFEALEYVNMAPTDDADYAEQLCRKLANDLGEKND